MPKGTKDMARRIAYWRAEAGLRPSQLATAIGVDRAAVAHWEDGDASPTYANLTAIADACGIGLSKFFGPMPTKRRAG